MLTVGTFMVDGRLCAMASRAFLPSTVCSLCTGFKYERQKCCCC